VKTQDKEALCKWLETLDDYPNEGVRGEIASLREIVAAIPEGATGTLDIYQDGGIPIGRDYCLDLGTTTFSIGIYDIYLEWCPSRGPKMFLMQGRGTDLSGYEQWAREHDVPIEYFMFQKS
jgi:hypothetical protein